MTFERALDAIEASDAGYHEPRAGEVLSIGSARLEVVNPDRITGELHEGSISVRVVYGNVAFMFTGDAETHTEQAMVRREHDLTAQILQLGHHGSRTSTSEEFLGAVRPEVAISSGASGNSYGHPHSEVIDRLNDWGIPFYGTDTHGTIQVVTDGLTYEVMTERGDAPRPPPDAPTVTPAPTPAPGVHCQSGQVDINTASMEELQQITHIGPDRAEQIVSLRPFHSVDDLTQVSGLGPARLADIREQGVA